MNQRSRICVMGDELVAGVGDAKALGWVGRVAARTDVEPVPMFFTLAVPGEGTAGLSDRWEAEATRRFAPDADNRVVLSVGIGDCLAGVSVARSRLNLANVLDGIERHRAPVMVVGPPPLSTDIFDVIGALSDGCADVCARRNVPYVDTFTPLVSHEQWLADLAAGDGLHPGQAGYGLMAWLILHTGWHVWLGAEDASNS